MPTSSCPLKSIVGLSVRPTFMRTGNPFKAKCLTSLELCDKKGRIHKKCESWECSKKVETQKIRQTYRRHNNSRTQRVYWITRALSTRLCCVVCEHRSSLSAHTFPRILSYKHVGADAWDNGGGVYFLDVS